MGRLGTDDRMDCQITMVYEQLFRVDFFKHNRNCIFKGLNFRVRNIPENIWCYLKVRMSNNIPKTSNLSPIHIRLFI